MAGFSDYVEDKIINLTLRNTAFAAVATPYVMVHVGDPTDTGTGGTPTGGARQSAAFDAPAGGATSNSALITFAGVNAGTYTHVSVWDALAGGNMLYSGSLTASKTADAGDNLSFAAGELDIVVT